MTRGKGRPRGAGGNHTPHEGSSSHDDEATNAERRTTPRAARAERPSREDVGASMTRPVPVRYPNADEILSGYVRTLPSEVFVKLYARERAFVTRTVMRYGVPARDADDITQEVFEVALRRIEDHDAARSARPWLFVIAMQLATNYRKLARHRIEPLSGDTPPEPTSDGPDVEAKLVASEEQALAREILDRMTPKLRAILVMHDLEERPMAEIAEELGIQPSTGYARLKLAREEILRRGRAVAASALAMSAQGALRRKDLLLLRDVFFEYLRTQSERRSFRRPRGKPRPRRYPRYEPRSTYDYPVVRLFDL